MLSALLIAFIFGILVYAIGTLFDPSGSNRYAAICALIVFVLVFITRSGIDL